MDDAYEETIHLACDARAVRSARNFVASTLRRRGWSAGDVERAQLAVSELVANAVVHARTEATMHVRIDESVRLEVVDGAPDLHPRLRQSDPRRAGGLGLHLIAAVAASWGVERTSAAKSVWCVVEPAAPVRRPAFPGPHAGGPHRPGPGRPRPDLSYS
jgi:anti-sigma regulatory factor (Ser/Thr protein kinase)